MSQHAVRVRSRDQHPIDIKVEAKSLTQLSFAVSEIQRWASKVSASESCSMCWREDHASSAIVSHLQRNVA